MTRRGFLRHTGRLAASGLTAAAIADRLAKDTTAQNVRKAAAQRPQRVAVIFDAYRMAAEVGGRR
jgi:hypothetical protein